MPSLFKICMLCFGFGEMRQSVFPALPDDLTELLLHASPWPVHSRHGEKQDHADECFSHYSAESEQRAVPVIAVHIIIEKQTNKKNTN